MTDGERIHRWLTQAELDAVTARACHAATEDLSAALRDARERLAAAEVRNVKADQEINRLTEELLFTENELRKYKEAFLHARVAAMSQRATGGDE